MSAQDPTPPPDAVQPPPRRRGLSWGFIVALVLIAIVAQHFLRNDFLRASTRSKEARARSDMRSLAAAIESYYVDNNAYPAWTDDPMLAETGEPRDAIDLRIARLFGSNRTSTIR